MLHYSRILSGVIVAKTISKIGVIPPSQNGRVNIMQGIFVFFFVFCISTASAFAQDVITLKNGDDIHALVQEIGEVDIKYKKIDNPNGPNYTQKKSEVFMIKYVNGSKDVFTEQQNPDIEKKDEMQHANISQRVPEIAIFNTKELEKVLAEALEKISPFEELCSKIVKLDGVIIFYEQEYPLLKKNFTYDYFGGLTKQSYAIADQTLMDITGGTTLDELAEDFNKRLGRKPFFNKGMATYYRAYEVLCTKNFTKSKDWVLLRSSYAQEVEELMPYFNMSVDEMEKSSFMLIPLDYRYSHAIETMLGFVKNRRASTWKECADLYEEWLHRRIMEKNSAESLQIQRDIRNLTAIVVRNTRATAIFSGLNFIFN